MMEIFHQLTLLFSVRCSESFFVHNREGDDKMSVDNEKMQTDVATGFNRRKSLANKIRENSRINVEFFSEVLEEQ